MNKDWRVDWKARPEEWPPHSPDLACLDFYLWGHLKANMYAVKVRSIQHLLEKMCCVITPQRIHAILMEWHKNLPVRFGVNDGLIIFCNTYVKIPVLPMIPDSWNICRYPSSLLLSSLHNREFNLQC